MLGLENVELAYGPVRALKKISLEVHPGEIVTMIGANGAGKTSTLTAISGLHRLVSGAIWYQGQRIDGVSPERIAQKGVIHIPEGRRIFSGLTVWENLLMGAYHRKDQAQVQSDVREVFSLFPVLEQRKKQPGGTLSGGEQQMLAIGRGLMSKPRLMMLDEPSLGLAPKLVKEVFQVIQKINRDDGVTILLVEQNATRALQISNRAYVLETGEITLSGDSHTLLSNPLVQKAYLGM